MTDPAANSIFARNVLFNHRFAADEIDVQCNFFEAGGNSLLATQLVLDLEKELDVQVPLVKIFQYPTVLTLAGYLRKNCIESKA